MKIRNGFVSNSSSSSFVIARYLLTDDQLAALYSYCATPIGPYNDEWSITEDEHYVRGYTIIDNNMDEPGGLVDWFARRGITGMRWE